MGKAFVLLSGGIDSTTCLALAIRDYGHDKVEALSVSYGQSHETHELRAAACVAEYYNIPHRILDMRPDMPRGGLTDINASDTLPDVTYGEITGVSPSYVPFRNGLLLAKAAGIAQAEGGEGSAVYAGQHAEDAAGGAYPDCGLDFIGAMAAAITIGTYHHVQLKAPLIQMFKPEVIKLGASLGAPYHLTRSCYRDTSDHCGRCSTCYARAEGFDAADVEDPTIYEIDPRRSRITDLLVDGISPHLKL